ncbi:MAG TPA: tetratricopeptide repeat protein, partial [Gemmatimonadales bacterium]|nr:tetratricopeptide repeat protein [Gemmatimonadales bacterium]
LRLLRDGAHGLEFVNELVRGQVYTATPKSLRKSLHGSIANLLLADPADADELETAWHCVRSGRVEEARPRIISGAQACIERGALHEAELGLSSALKLLDGDFRIRALLLLSEVLQGQARWQESLNALELMDFPEVPSGPSNYFREKRTVLTTAARVKLGSIPTSDLSGTALDLCRALRGTTDPRTISLAARACANMASITRDQVLAVTLLEDFARFSIESWPMYESGLLLLSRALLHFCCCDYAHGLEALNHASRVLQLDTSPSQLAGDILVGYGVIHAATGRYQAGIEHLLRAVALAKRMGNDWLLILTAGNLAICFGRTGDYRAQVEWGTLTVQRGHPENPYLRVQGLYSVAHGHARLGHTTEAVDALTALAAEPLEFAPAYVDQARHLYCAEVFELLGRRGDAIRHGRRGVTGKHLHLHSTNFAGLYARWLARTATITRDQNAMTKIATLASEIERYDRVDQDEILRALSELHEISTRT